MKIFESGLHRLCVILVLFMVLLPVLLFSQQPTKCDYVRPHEADQWTFGLRSQLDFSQGTPVALAMPGSIEFFNGMSTISDPDGNLLFFSDGMSVYTNGYYLLDGTDDLHGNKGSTQSSIFIPEPGNENRYYLFTVDMYLLPVFKDGIRYSVIEKIDGLWKITLKDQILFDKPNAQKIAAVKASNGIDYWVIVHGYGQIEGDKFYAYKITNNGIDLTPVVSQGGTIQKNDDMETFTNNGGNMKVSTDGSLIALVIPTSLVGVIEIFNFNNESGEISLISTSGGQFNVPTGVEFSPDNSYLYVSTSPAEITEVSFVYQFGLKPSVNWSNPVILDNFISNDEPDNRVNGALQLGVDGKIYLANYRYGGLDLSYLSVINNPNRLGLECNFNEIDHATNSRLFLNSTGSVIGLPNFVSTFLDIPQITYVNHCATEITYFNLRNNENIDNILWDFGDGNSSTIEDGTENTFQTAGNYTVNVTEKYGSGTYTYDRDITIYPLPSVDLGDSIIYILQNTSITLDAGEYDEYLWQPGGSTDRYLDVSNEGIYTATVTDTNCCVNTDEVEIRYANIYVPNAFKPTSSVTENKTFKVFGPTSALLDFDLKIFNRWGQLVFTSNDPEKGWDGTFEGGDAATGVYVWVLNYSSTASRYQESQSYTLHGTLTLLR
jgi:gliding motility-associated-like protein